MKKITIVIIAILFTFTGIAQEKINWLTTSEFEKAIKKEKQNVFIFIEDDRVNENMPKERAEEMQKRMFAFLEDYKVIDHINKNFICYKFNPKTESLNFQGKEYKQIDCHVKKNILSRKKVSCGVRTGKKKRSACAFFYPPPRPRGGD